MPVGESVVILIDAPVLRSVSEEVVEGVLRRHTEGHCALIELDRHVRGLL